MNGFVSGALLSAGLIVAIGPQNLHVLRTGLGGRHLLLTVLLCVGADALLLGLALAGAGGAPADDALGSPLVAGVAALLLAGMAWQALREAWRTQALPAAAAGPAGWRTSAARTLAVSIGNPAVWIELLLVIGAAARAWPDAERAGFAAGVLAASALWFTALAFGARLAARWLARPAMLRALAAASALMLGGMAARLLHQAAPGLDALWS